MLQIHYNNMQTRLVHTWDRGRSGDQGISVTRYGHVIHSPPLLPHESQICNKLHVCMLLYKICNVIVFTPQEGLKAQIIVNEASTKSSYFIMRKLEPQP